jgi:hypothetical protein
VSSTRLSDSFAQLRFAAGGEHQKDSAALAENPLLENPFRLQLSKPANAQDTRPDGPMPILQNIQPAQFTEIPGPTGEADLPLPGAPVPGSTVDSTPGQPPAGEGPGASDVVDELESPLEMMPVDGEIGGPWDYPMETDAPLLYSSNSWFRRGYWYSQQEGVMLLRTKIEDVLIAADTAPGDVSNIVIGGHATLNSTDADFTYEPGVKLTLGRFFGQDIINRDHSVEATFLGLFEYSNSAALTTSAREDDDNQLQTFLGNTIDYDLIPASALEAIGDVPGFSRAQRYTIKFETDLNSFEFNYRIAGRPVRDRLTLQPSGEWVRHASPSRWKAGLLGIRFVSISEMFRYNATFRDPTQNGGDYILKTHNDMIGPQIGGEAAAHYGPWAWGIRFKTGGLVNFADRNNRVDILSGGVTSQRLEELSDEHLAVFAEGGLFAEWHIRPNFVARSGYDFMYFNGVAAAPQNLSLAASFPKFDVTGDAIFHGLSIGFEMLW